MDKIISNLRQMAWERAKGELKSILHCFWGEEKEFHKFKTALENFIKEIEDNSSWL